MGTGSQSLLKRSPWAGPGLSLARSRRPEDSRSGWEEGEAGGWYLRQCRQEQTVLEAGVTDDFSPRTHALLSLLLILVWGCPQRWDSRGQLGTPESPRPGRESQVSARSRGGALAGQLGAGKQTIRARRGRVRRTGDASGHRDDHLCSPLATSSSTAAPHHLRRHLFHRFLRLPPGECLSLWGLSSFCSSLLPLFALLW